LIKIIVIIKIFKIVDEIFKNEDDTNKHHGVIGVFLELTLRKN